MPRLLAALVCMGLVSCLLLMARQPTDPVFEACYAVRMAVLSRDVGKVRDQLRRYPHLEINCRKSKDAPTLLGYAAAINSVDIAQLLLDEGANPELADDGFTPLMEASAYGFTELAALLLERGAEVNVQEPEYGMTALAEAVRYRHPKTVRLLLAHGADRNHLLRDGRFMVQLALEMADPETLKALGQP